MPPALSAPTSWHGCTNSPYVAQVISPWTAPPSVATSLISKDGNTGLIVAGITGGQNGAQQHAETLSNELVHDRDGVTVRAGGDAIAATQINQQTQEDLKLMETIAIPLSFLVLVWVFGGVVAAALPLAVGGLAIFGSMAVLRAFTFATDVSIFALNLSVAMGLALAIDYTLLILSRFRDELATGAGREEALMRTMATAGRTVLFSSMTVALSMSVTGAVSDVLPEVVCLRRCRGGGARGFGRDRGDSGGHCAARATIWIPWTFTSCCARCCGARNRSPARSSSISSTG